MPVSARSLVALSLAAFAQAAVHEVNVGKGGLKFDPEVVKAEVGDTIQYNFFSRNHSVAQSSFDKPCQPLDDGFFSGFVQSESTDTASTTTFTIKVKDEKPIWVYCSQPEGDHCQKGMVHAINPPEKGNTFEAYKKAAKDADKSKSPPGSLPTGGVRRASIQVGKDGLTFEPNNILEPKGTVISFNFHPKNHTVTQSTFKKPCQPLDKGFSSGFIPTNDSPSGIQFEFTLEDEDPVWYYCGQGNHCQSGMVGAVNAIGSNNTIHDFIYNAKNAPLPNSIPPSAPLRGTLLVDGKPAPTFDGNVLPSSPSPTSTPNDNDNASPSPATPTRVPPPGPDAPQWFTDKAGGGKPTQWNWAANLSSDAAALLQLHARIEDALLRLLWDVYTRVQDDDGIDDDDDDGGGGGSWAGVYPPAIVDTIGAWAAQSLVHRATLAEVLLHYDEGVSESCAYRFFAPDGGVDDALEAFNRLNSLQIGAAIDSAAALAESDPFVVPLLVTQVGAKSRAAGVVNMMLNRLAAAAPREVALPAKLAWSYLTANFVESCPDEIEEMPEEAWPKLEVEKVMRDEVGVSALTVDLKYDAEKETDGQAAAEHYVAWLGPYGTLEFSPIDDEGGEQTAVVPAGWYGDVWAVVVDQDKLKLEELANHVVAGPEMIWLREP
ncbi:hypothetical protein VTK26DRAFT_309 [Humicola hyalothermophila]